MNSFDDFMFAAADCFTYKADQLSTLMQQGGTDCELKKQVTFMGIMLETILMNTEKQCLTSEECDALAATVGSICGNSSFVLPDSYPVNIPEPTQM